jgi:hypothetical protein
MSKDIEDRIRILDKADERPDKRTASNQQSRKRGQFFGCGCLILIAVVLVPVALIVLSMVEEQQAQNRSATRAVSNATYRAGLPTFTPYVIPAGKFECDTQVDRNPKRALEAEIEDNFEAYWKFNFTETSLVTGLNYVENLYGDKYGDEHIQWMIDEMTCEYRGQSAIGYRQLKQQFALEAERNAKEALKEANEVAQNRQMTRNQKEDQFVVLQRKYGEELIASIMRRVPIYEATSERFISFDSYMRGFNEEFGSGSSAPIETDPVGAGMRIFFDPSAETIEEMLGLDDW